MAGNASGLFDNWTVQVRKGILEFAILNALLGRERYGYELAKELAAIPGLGCSEGTIYPALSRLRLQGFVTTRIVESHEGPPRKYYAIAASGRNTVRMMRRFLTSLVQGTLELGGKGKTDG